MHWSVGVVFFLFVDLYRWVLGINLPLYKSLQMLGRPDIKAQAPVNRGYLQADVLLECAREFEFALGAQDAV